MKPNAGGSSFGVTKVKSADQIHEAILKAMRESDEVMVEAFMEGTEISQGCYKTQEKEVVLPATEVVSDNEFSITTPSTTDRSGKSRRHA